MIGQWFQGKPFASKTVFITGGGSGINFGIAQAFSSLGANVAICGRTRSRLEEAAAKLREAGSRVSVSVADVRDYAAIEKALAASEAELGPVDTLVCGAAGNFVALAGALSSNGFKTVLDIDLLGSFNAARAAFAQLRTTKGSILFVSSGHADAAFIGQSHVAAAKAGVEALMRNLALEWGPFGIRSNSIVPGPVENTEGMERLISASSRETWDAMVPLGRMARIEEIAAMAIFLASPLASYVNGAQMTVDGGMAVTGPGLFNATLAVAMMQADAA